MHSILEGNDRIYGCEQGAVGPPGQPTSGSGPDSLVRLRRKDDKMHPQDLMLPDRFSTIVLLGVVGLTVISLLVLVMVVLA